MNEITIGEILRRNAAKTVEQFEAEFKMRHGYYDDAEEIITLMTIIRLKLVDEQIITRLLNNYPFLRPQRIGLRVSNSNEDQIG